METIIDLITTCSPDQNHPKQFRYSLNFTGLDLIKVASYNLRLPYDAQSTIWYVNQKRQTVQIEEFKTLAEQEVRETLVIFLLPKTSRFDLYRSTVYSNAKLAKLKFNDTEEKVQTHVNVNIDANFLDFSNEFDEKLDFAPETLVEMLCYEKHIKNKKGPCKFYQTMTNDQVIATAKAHLDRKYIGDYTILIEYPKNEFKFMGRTNRLDFYEVTEKCKIHLFPKVMPITVSSVHFKKEVFHIDITNSVEKIIQIIAQEKKLGIYHDYTLSYEEDGTTYYLSKSKEIPSQIEKFDNLKLVRRYYNFSREDIIDETRAKKAFNDTLMGLPSMNVYPTDDQIIDLMYYSYCAMNPGDTINLLPPSYAGIFPSINIPAKMRDKVIKKYGKARNPDLLNSTRLFLRAVRSIPGFGSEIYSIYLEEDENMRRHTSLGQTIISPTSITIVSKKQKKSRSSDDGFFYRIPFIHINSVTQSEDMATIDYMDHNKNYVITIRFPYYEELNMFIIYYQENTAIIRDIIAERARKRANGEKIHFKASFETVELYTTTSYKDNAPSRFIYDKAMTGKMLVEEAMANLNISGKEEDYQALLVKGTGSYEWIDKDKVIASTTILDNQKIILSPSYIISKIHFTGSITKTMKIDMRLTVHEIIQTILQKIQHPESETFCLCTVNDRGKEKILDWRQYIPTQTTNTKELLFRRRLFMLSNEDTVSRAVRLQTVNDCLEYLRTKKTSVTLEQSIELAILYKYCVAKDMYSVSKDKGETLAQEIPPWFKCDKKVRDTYVKQISRYEALDQVNATKRFIKIVRSIPDFGSESYDIMYYIGEELNDINDLKKGVLIVNGTGIRVKDGDKGVRISWLEISHIKSLVQYVGLRYQLEKDKNDIKKATAHMIYIFPRDLKDTKLIKSIHFIITQYINCMTVLNKKKKNKIRNEPIEAASRIEGTFIDSTGVKHEKEIDIFVGTNPNVTTGLEKIWVPLSATKTSEEITKCFNILSIDSRIDYFHLLFINRKTYYFEDDKTIGDYHPTRSSYLFFIKNDNEFNVKIGNETKKLRFKMSDLGIEVFQKAVEQFQIVDPYNFSLYVITSISPIAIQMDKRIGAQISLDSTLSLKRHSYIIPEPLNDNRDFITDMFDEIKLSYSQIQGVHFPDETVKKLALLALIAEKGGTLRPSDIRDDLSGYTPKSSPLKKSDIKLLKDICKDVPYTNYLDHMKDYITRVRNLPMFADFYFPCTSRDGTKCFLFIDKENIYVTEKDSKEILLKVPFRRLIKFTSANLDPKRKSLYHIKIIYVNKNFEEEKYLLTSLLNEVISDEIERVKKAAQKEAQFLYMPKITSYSKDPQYKVTINTISCVGGRLSSAQIIYDTRYSYKQAIKEIKKIFNYNYNSSLRLFASVSKKRSKLIETDSFISDLHLLPQQEIYVYDTITRIKVNGYIEAGRKMEAVFPTIDTRKPLSEAIPLIAEKFNIQFYNGYSLIHTNNETGAEMELDVNTPIFEQVHFLDGFKFVRNRFALSPTYDFKNANFSLQIFDDVFREYLRGKIEVDAESVIRFALYSVVVHSANEDEYENCQITNFDEYIPWGHNMESNYFHSFILLKTNTPYFDRNIAAQKFLTEIFRIRNFSANVYQDLEYRVFNATDHREDAHRAAISINYKGITLVYENNLNKESSVFVRHEEVVCTETSDHILMIDYVGSKTKKFEVLKISGKNLANIKRDIDLFRNYLIPELNRREKTQKFWVNETAKIKDENKVTVSLSNSYTHPISDIATIDLSYTGEQAKKFICSYFSADNPNDYELYARYTINNEEEIYNIKPTDVLNNIELKEGDNLLIVKITTNFFVTIPSGKVKNVSINVTKPVFSVIDQIMKELNLGFGDGFGIVYRNENGNKKFMKFKRFFFAHKISSREIILMRRAYLFSVRSFEDENTMKTVTQDSVMYLRSKKFDDMNEACRLAALISQIKDIYVKEDDDNIENYHKELFPIGFEINDQALIQFSKEFKEIINKKLTRTQLMAQLIYEAIQYEGYGSSKYKCSAVINDTTVDECSLLINPYCLKCRNKDKELFAYIPMDLINSYLVNDDVLTIQFTNNREKKIATFRSNDLEEVYEYISFVTYLAGKHLYLSSLKLLNNALLQIINPENVVEEEEEVQVEEKEEEEEVKSEVEQSSEDEEVDYQNTLINFDEINDDFQDGYSLNFMTGYSTNFMTNYQTAYQTGFQMNDQEIYFNQTVNEQDIIWRMSIKALMTIRLFNTLGAILQYITTLTSQLDLSDQQKILLKLKQLLQIVEDKSYNYDEKIEQARNSAIEAISKLIETSTNDGCNANLIEETLIKVSGIISEINNESDSAITKLQSETASLIGVTGLTTEQMQVIKQILDVVDSCEFLACLYKQKSCNYIVFNKGILHITNAIEKVNEGILNIIIKVMKDHDISYFYKHVPIELNNMSSNFFTIKTFNTEVEMLKFNVTMEINLIRQAKAVIEHVLELIENADITESTQQNPAITALSNIANSVNTIRNIISEFNFDFSNYERSIFVITQNILESVVELIKVAIETNVEENLSAAQTDITILFRLLKIITEKILVKHEEFAHQREEIRKQILESHQYLLCISSIHITPRAIKKLVVLLGELIDAFNKVESEKREDTEFTDFLLFASDTKDFFQGTLHNIDNYPDDLTTIGKIREQAISLMKEFSQSLVYFRANLDVEGFSTIAAYIESILVAVNSICVDGTLYYNLNTIPHVLNFHNLQSVVLEIYSNISQNNDLERYMPNIKETYEQFTVYRDLLHINPNSVKVAKEIIDFINKFADQLHKVLDDIEFASVNQQFVGYLIDAQKKCVTTVESLAAVKPREVTIPPTLAQISITEELTKGLIEQYKAFMNLPEIVNNPGVQKSLTDSIDYFVKYQSFFQTQKRKPTVKFFKFFSDFDIITTNIKKKLSLVSSFDTAKFFNRVYNDINIIKMMTQSSFQYTGRLMMDTKALVDKLVSLLNIKASQETEPDFINYINDFIHELSPISSALNNNLEENVESAALCLAIRKFIETKAVMINNLSSNSFFSRLGEFFKDICTVTDNFGKIIAAIEYLPFVQREFPEIEEVGEIVDIHQTLLLVETQMAIFTLISQTYEFFPDIVYCKSLRETVSDFKKLINDYVGIRINEDDVIPLAKELLKKKDEIIKYSYILEPVFSIPSFTKNILVLFSNFEAVVNYSDKLHINEIIPWFLNVKNGLMTKINTELSDETMKQAIKNDLSEIKNIFEVIEVRESSGLIQQQCNDLQKLTAKAINELLCIANKNALIDSLYEVYQQCTKYSTDELEYISYTKNILLEDNPELEKIPAEVLSSISLFDFTKEIDVTQLKQTFETISENAPKYAANDLRAISENINSHNRNLIGAALRAAAATAGNEKIIKNHEQIVILSSLTIYNVVLKINDAINDVNRTIEEQDVKVQNNNLLIEINKVQSVISEFDIDVLRQFRTLDVVANLFNKLCVVYKCTPLIYLCLSAEQPLTNYVPLFISLLEEFSTEFSILSNNLFALFFTYFAVLLKAIEKCRIKDDQVLQFISRCSNILLFTDRFISIDYKTTYQLVDLFNTYISTIHPIVIKELEDDQDALSNVNYAFNTALKIVPFAEKWKASFITTNNTALAASVESRTICSTIMNNKCITDNEVAPLDVKFDLTGIRISIGFIQLCIESSTSSSADYTAWAKFVSDILVVFDTLPADQIKGVLEHINKGLETLFRLSREAMDYNELQELINSDADAINNTEIEDEDCKTFKESVEGLISDLSNEENKFEKSDLSAVDLITVNNTLINTQKVDQQDPMKVFNQIISDFNAQTIILNTTLLLSTCIEQIASTNSHAFNKVNTRGARQKFIKKLKGNELSSMTQDICNSIKSVSCVSQVLELANSYSEDQTALLLLVLKCIISNIIEKGNNELYSSHLYERACKQSLIYQQLRGKLPITMNVAESLNNTNKLIASTDSQITLLQYLILIKQHLLINSKVEETKNTAGLLKERINNSTLYDNQNLLKGQINLAQSPKLLDMTQKTFSCETIIAQIRIIDSMIKRLVDTDEILISSSKRDVTVFDVFSVLAEEQISHLRNFSDTFEIKTLFDHTLIEKAQNKVIFETNMMQTAQKIMTLANSLMNAQSVEGIQITDFNAAITSAQRFVDFSFVNSTITAEMLKPREATEQLKIVSAMLENLFSNSVQKTLSQIKEISLTNPIVVILPDTPINDLIKEETKKKERMEEMILSLFNKQSASLEASKQAFKKNKLRENFINNYQQSQFIEELSIGMIEDSVTPMSSDTITDYDSVSRFMKSEKIKVDISIRIRQLQNERENLVTGNPIMRSNPDTTIQQMILQQIIQGTPEVTNCDFHAGQIVLERAASICRNPQIICQSPEEMMNTLAAELSKVSLNELVTIRPLKKNQLADQIEEQANNAMLCNTKNVLSEIYKDALSFASDNSKEVLTPLDIIIEQSKVKRIAESPENIHQIHQNMNKEEIKKEILFLEGLLLHSVQSANSCFNLHSVETLYQPVVSRFVATQLTKRDFAKSTKESVSIVSEIIRTVSKLSVDVCFDIAKEEIGIILNCLKKIIESKSCLILSDFRVLAESAPKLFSVLTRTIPVMKEEQDIDVSDPEKMMATLKLLGRATCDKENKQIAVQSRNELCSLYTDLMIISEAIKMHSMHLEAVDIKKEVISSISNITIASNEGNVEKIITSYAKLQSYIKQNNGVEGINDILPTVEEIYNIAVNVYSSGENISNTQRSELIAKKDKIIPFLSVNQFNNFNEVQSASVIFETTIKIIDSTDIINKMSLNLKEGNESSLLPLLNQALVAVSYAGRAASISDSNAYITNIIVSCEPIIKSISTFIEERNSYMNYEVKKFAKQIGKLLSKLNHKFEESNTERDNVEKDAFYLLKLDFLKTLATSMEFASLMTAEVCSSQLTAVFLQRIIQMIGIVDQSFMTIPAKANEILKKNTNEAAGFELYNATAGMMNEYSRLREQIQQEISKESFILRSKNCIEILKRICVSLEKTTDKAQ